MRTIGGAGTKKIMEEFKHLTKGRNPVEFERMKKIIEGLSDSRKLGFELQLGSGMIALFKLPVREAERQDWLELALMIDNELMGRGYRRGEKTYQEARMAGNTGEPVLSGSPHMPEGLFFGKLTIGEAREARRLTAVFRVYPQSYKVEPNMDADHWAALEPLDDSGRTMRDPRLVDIGIFSKALRKGVPLETAFERADLHAEISKQMEHPHLA